MFRVFSLLLLAALLSSCAAQFPDTGLGCSAPTCGSAGGGNLGGQSSTTDGGDSQTAPPPTVANAAPTGLSITGPAETTPNTCAGPFKVSFVNNNSQEVVASAARTVSLGFETRDGAAGRFYTDGQCNNLGSSLAFTANLGAKDIWFKHPAATVVFLVATDSLTFFEATFKLNVRAAAGALLARANLTRDIYTVLRYNTTAEKNWSITNVGAATATNMSLTLSAPFAFKGGTYPGTGGTCGATLAAGATCSIVAIATANDNNGRSADSISLLNSFAYLNGTTAMALDFPQNLVMIPKTLALRFDNGPQFNFAPQFGGQGAGAPKIITVTNISNMAISNLLISVGANLNDSSSYAFEGGTFPGTKGNCTATIAAGTSCKISLVNIANTTTGYSAGARALNAQFLLGNSTSATTEMAGMTAFGIP